jgi:hypothetical protein
MIVCEKKAKKTCMIINFLVPLCSKTNAYEKINMD